jgi:hypothetical protein
MNTTSTPFNGNYLIAAILGILAVVLVFFFLTGRPIPLISGERAAFIALAVLGLAMCATGGIGTAIGQYGWAHPITIIGSILGVLALVLVGATLLNIRLPLVPDDRAAFIALAVLGFAKVVVEGVATRLLA